MRKLSDAEQSIVLQAASPLDRAGRQPFIDAVARRLGSMPQGAIGPGTVSRICRELQRQHWVPPALAGHAPPRRLW